MRFPELTISGTPDERGNAHGEALSSEIESTIDFYASIFKKSSVEIFDRAKHFRRVIRDYNPAYCEEIEGIAAGAKIREPLWIYALNSRSEILALDASVGVNECTALWFQSTALLGQTWDWGRRLEQLAVLLQIRISEDQTIQMLTEPGIIGKIGMNSHGIGTCLNILRINKPLIGVPIHIVLRAVLESKTIEEAKMAIHTNHYLARPINPDEGRFCNSYARFRAANDKASSLDNFTIDEMKTILADRSDREHPICCAYEPDADIQEAGTVATIVMDLKADQLHIRKGNIKEHNKESGSMVDQNSAESTANDYVIAFES